MAKRKRNSIGQFTSNDSGFTGSKFVKSSNNYLAKISALFMTIFFLFMVSPWLTLVLKSKKLKLFLYSLLRFYSDHFINDEEILNSSKCKNQNDI